MALAPEAVKALTMLRSLSTRPRDAVLRAGLRLGLDVLCDQPDWIEFEAERDDLLAHLRVVDSGAAVIASASAAPPT